MILIKKNKGFTLIELVVVIFIISFLITGLNSLYQGLFGTNKKIINNQKNYLLENTISNIDNYNISLLKTNDISKETNNINNFNSSKDNNIDLTYNIPYIRINFDKGKIQIFKEIYGYSNGIIEKVQETKINNEENKYLFIYKNNTKKYDIYMSDEQNPSNGFDIFFIYENGNYIGKYLVDFNGNNKIININNIEGKSIDTNLTLFINNNLESNNINNIIVFKDIINNNICIRDFGDINNEDSLIKEKELINEIVNYGFLKENMSFKKNNNGEYENIYLQKNICEGLNFKFF